MRYVEAAAEGTHKPNKMSMEGTSTLLVEKLKFSAGSYKTDKA